MYQSDIKEQNLISKVLSSNLFLPGIFFILSISAFILFSPYVKATPTGITQIGCKNCEQPAFNDLQGVAIDTTGNVFVVDSPNNHILKLSPSGVVLQIIGGSAVGSYGGSIESGANGEFNRPKGVTLDSSNNIYVADSQNNRIQKFDSNGNFITKWGSSSLNPYGGSGSGTGDGEFNDPVDITSDSSGNVYVTDDNNNRIQKFDSSGNFITKWGTNGSGDGEFNYPGGLATDSSGNVYVADSQNNRIQKFDSTGNFITKWGTNGSGDGQFDGPKDVAIDSSGNVYVADSSNNRIQKFDSDGVYDSQWTAISFIETLTPYPTGIAINSNNEIFLTQNRLSVGKYSNNGTQLALWGRLNASSLNDGGILYPSSVAIAPDKNYYEVDFQMQRIQKFSANGDYISKIDNNPPGPYGFPEPAGGDGEFYYPYYAAVDSSGNVYVSDTGNNRIQKFDSSGNFVTKWGSSSVGPYGGSASGGGDGEFNQPTGIDVDSSGNVYVADNGNNRVQKFDSNGNFIAKWGSSEVGSYGGSAEGGGNGEFSYPFGITVDSSGNVYVSDSGNNRIQKFDSNGNFITKWGSSSLNSYGGSESGSGNGEFSYPYGIDVDSAGNVYVADAGNNRIQKFDSNGNYLSKYQTVANDPAIEPIVMPLNVASAGNGKLYVANMYSMYRASIVTLCDNDVSTDGCASTGGSNVTTLTSAENNTPITLTQTGCTTVSNSSTTKESSLTTADPAYSYPVGLVSFTLNGCTTGGTATITATFTGSFDPTKTTIRKYNPTTNTYTTLTQSNSNLSLSTTTLNNQPALQVTYTITDGGSLDQDNQANGTIIDPVGLAQSAIGVPNTGL